MTNDRQIADRADDLLERYFDRTIAESEVAELLALWDRLPQTELRARDYYFSERLFQLKRAFCETMPDDRLAALRKHVQATPAPSTQPSTEKRSPADDDILNTLDFFLLDPDELARLAAASPSLPRKAAAKKIPPKPLKQPKPYKAEKSQARWLPALILLGLTLLATAIYHEFRPTESRNIALQKPFRPFAVIDSVLDVEWAEDDRHFKEGRRLEAETLRFQAGIVQLVLNNGVRLAIRGPADIRLNTVGKVFCGQGELSATVPASGKGFEVVTPFLSVVDLGTEFLVDVGKDGVETHTIRGRVELNRLSDEEKVDLPAGDAFRLEAGGLAKRFEAEPSRFLTDLFVGALREKRDTVQLDRWTADRARLLAASGLRVLLDFEDDAHSGRLLGARACEGRWRGKKAVEFKGRNDAVGFELPGEMASATLFASLRLDALDRFNHVILASRTMDDGNFIWQIGADGCVQLTVKSSDHPVPRTYRGRPVFQRRHCGAWYRLTTVYDTEKKEIRTFLDDEPVDTLPLSHPAPLRLGDATLGNLRPEKRTATDSSLGGRIDQFMIFDNVRNPI